MNSKFKSTWFRASLGEGKTSNQSVDYDNYAELLIEAYEKLDADGYDVINVVPITMGEIAYGDIPFSITRGAVLVGKKRGS